MRQPSILCAHGGLISGRTRRCALNGRSWAAIKTRFVPNHQEEIQPSQTKSGALRRADVGASWGAAALGASNAARGGLCTVVDDATLAFSRGSINVDDEGNAPTRSVLIENGTLTGYMHDRHSAGVFGVRASGNGRRESFKSHPLPRMTNTLLLAGQDDPEDILRSVKRGIYARRFGGGQVDISNGDFVFSLTESYLIEDGKLTAPLKGVNLIGNGPDVMRKVVMLGRDFETSDGVWTCGKDGQSVPVGVGCPTMKISSVTVGGTQVER